MRFLNTKVLARVRSAVWVVPVVVRMARVEGGSGVRLGGMVSVNVVVLAEWKRERRRRVM